MCSTPCIADVASSWVRSQSALTVIVRETGKPVA
jgi:hypothetical protein